MSDETLTVDVVQTVLTPLTDVPHAPFVFFDNVPSYGQLPGIITVALSAARMLPDSNGNVQSAPVVIAYLRTNEIGARQLHAALDQALRMTTVNAVPPPSTEGKPN